MPLFVFWPGQGLVVWPYGRIFVNVRKVMLLFKHSFRVIVSLLPRYFLV